jgi:Kef-type K+ transport system membrane component KefB
MIELAFIICLAAVLGVVAKLLKQPLILAFIATGIVIGLIQRYQGTLSLGDEEVFHLFSELGIMFLLFLIGLEMNYSSLKTVGKTSLAVGLGQILFTFTFGFLISFFLLGFNQIHSAYLAICLTFSSTIIIVKLLSDRKALNSLYGKISVGFLLVQDFVVILILIALTGITSDGKLNPASLLTTLFLGIFFFALMIFLGRSIFPKIFDRIAKSQELLFLVSLAWVFAMVAGIQLLEKYTGIAFSLEAAGFLAGLALANSSEHYQIANRIKPLRDFFILIFFVLLGSSIIFHSFSHLALPIIVLSLFVLIGNPLIVIIIMGLFMGYRKRTSFLSGVTVAQISEFSLILVALGLRLGHVTEEIVAIVAAVGISTITISTYLIINAEKIFVKLDPILKYFERKNLRDETGFTALKKPIILIGYDRTGRSIAHNIDKEKLLVVDFNPDIINELIEKRFQCIYADALDPLIFENIDFENADIVISTSPNLEDNLNLVTSLMNSSKRPRIVSRAETKEDAEILYSEGADYVFVPLFSSGQYLGKIINNDPKLENIQELKQKDILFMENI